MPENNNDSQNLNEVTSLEPDYSKFTSSGKAPKSVDTPITEVNNTSDSQPQPTASQPQLSSDAMKEFFKKNFNIDYTGDENQINQLKEKLTYTPPQPELSEEEKTRIQQQEDKEILDLYLSEGEGTIENFTRIKGILSSDPKESGLNLERLSLKEAGFSKEEAEEIINQRYFLNAVEKLDRDNFDSDEDFEAEKIRLERLQKLGEQKLIDKFSQSKTRAENFINNLKEEVSERKQRKAKEEAFAQKVGAYLESMPRKLEIDLGNDEMDKKVHYGTTNYDVTEQDISDLKEKLTPAALNKLLLTDDGDFNIENVVHLLLNKNSYSKIGRNSFIAGQKRMTEEYEKIHPYNTASAIGVGGNRGETKSHKGTFVRRGQPQVA